MGGVSYFYRVLDKCANELHQLEINASDFLRHVRDLEQQVTLKKMEITVYDEYIGRMTDVIEMTKIFNKKLVLHANGNSYSVNESDQRAIMAPINDEICETAMAKVEITDEEKEDYDHINFQYENKNLCNYNTGCELKLHVTHVCPYKSAFTFYARDTEDQDAFKMIPFAKVVQFKQYSELPPEGEVFGLLVNTLISRAVRSSKYSFLLDSGNVVLLKDTDIMYRLPKDMQKVPASAIHCQLESRPGASVNELKQYVMQLENLTAQFIVKKVTNYTLHLHCIENSEDDGESRNTNPFKADTKCMTNNVTNGFTPEELEQLHEEPLGTSNALKAVLGYVPTDEQRICRFYNPSTMTCFKGSHCHKDHEPLNPDGWTKDVVPAPFASANTHSYFFENDTIISITVTCVKQLDWIYAQINDAKVVLVPMVWSTENIPDNKRFKQLPLLYDLVLAKYVDGYWYRAKIIDIIEDYGVKVFFVDYGNSQMVSLKDLAECDKVVADIPHQAVRFRIVKNIPRVNDANNEDEINVFRNRVLNKTLDVQVVEQIGDDILIRFF